MNKLNKLFRALGMIIRKPWLLNLVLDENQAWKERVHVKRPGFTGLPRVSLRQLSGGLDETISPFLFLDGGSLPTDLALLRVLARKIPGCSYFEIGTWRGESAANVSPLVSECYTLDLADDEKRAAGMSEEYIADHAVLSRHLSNVVHLKGNSFRYDFTQLGRKFDLVFIDGDHHYDSVLNDTIKVLNSLCHENTIIVWHDYAFNPESTRYEVLAGILDGLPENLHARLFHVANTMCAVCDPGFDPAQSPERRSIFELRLTEHLS